MKNICSMNLIGTRAVDAILKLSLLWPYAYLLELFGANISKQCRMIRIIRDSYTAIYII